MRPQWIQVRSRFIGFDPAKSDRKKPSTPPISAQLYSDIEEAQFLCTWEAWATKSVHWGKGFWQVIWIEEGGESFERGGTCQVIQKETVQMGEQAEKTSTVQRKQKKSQVWITTSYTWRALWSGDEQSIRRSKQAFQLAWLWVNKTKKRKLDLYFWICAIILR